MTVLVSQTFQVDAVAAFEGRLVAGTLQSRSTRKTIMPPNIRSRRGISLKTKLGSRQALVLM